MRDKLSGRTPVDVINQVDTELPAAAAAADAAANPTAPGVVSFGMVFNGATWDRRPGSATEGTQVTTRNSIYTMTDGSNNAINTIRLIDSSNLILPVLPSLFNGTTWDRARNNNEATIFASAARTTTTNSADQTNFNARGVYLFLDITAVSGTTPTLDVKIQAKDPVSGAYVDGVTAAFNQKTAVGTDSLLLYPGILTSIGRSIASTISRTWRAVATIGGTTPSFTFSLGCSYVL